MTELYKSPSGFRLNVDGKATLHLSDDEARAILRSALSYLQIETTQHLDQATVAWLMENDAEATARQPHNYTRPAGTTPCWERNPRSHSVHARCTRIEGHKGPHADNTGDQLVTWEAGR